jgi:hypothetical protein
VVKSVQPDTNPTGIMPAVPEAQRWQRVGLIKLVTTWWAGLSVPRRIMIVGALWYLHITVAAIIAARMTH